ncbi:MAG: 50S ribosomal protein L25/general stress protein Ctc [Burkholderiales bacterium]
MQYEITASVRVAHGTGTSRRMRRCGNVPAVLYGAGKDTQVLELDHNALYQQLKQEAFHSSILMLDVGGIKEQVLLRDVQMHPVRPMILHVDFQRVSATKKIHIKVPLHFVNAEIAPGVKLAGGVVSHVISEVEVTCLPSDLPGFIEVDLANLESGHSIHLSDLKTPTGVELAELVRGENLTVASIPVKRAAEEEVVEAVAAEGAAEAAPAVAAGGKAEAGADKKAPAAEKEKKQPAAEKGKK